MEDANSLIDRVTSFREQRCVLDRQFDILTNTGNVLECQKSKRKLGPRLVLGPHDVQRGGTPKRANSRKKHGEITVTGDTKDHMMREEVARRNVPPPGNSYSPVNNSNSKQRVNFSRKPSSVLGSHDARRGGTPKRATPRFVLGSHVVRRGGTPKRAASSLFFGDRELWWGYNLEDI
ncbi:hypothetical protein HZH66_005965 [Vespula vulgaris]|uniref:Uncharacterized protein n=1 Tax=Vespula vulgaris TaxID=7454 RepID=A0A834K7T8_VESVU|nr:hypothetical protein HZH66_005965 [Vespula vulgaris]